MKKISEGYKDSLQFCGSIMLHVPRSRAASTFIERREKAWEYLEFARAVVDNGREGSREDFKLGAHGGLPHIGPTNSA